MTNAAAAEGVPALDAPDLSRLYHPRSIVVVGAHDVFDKRASLANMTRRLCDKADESGSALYLVNPRLPEVFGRKTYASIGDVPGVIDLLVIMVGDATAVLDEAAPKQPTFTIVFGGGYAEVDTDDARERGRKLLAAVRRANTRLIGPNTTINTLEKLRQLPGPRIALVTQSGSTGRPFAQAQEMGVALSYWATTGNEADLEAADFIEFFARDAETSVIAGYIEGFQNGQHLREAALTAIERDTPIVLVKIGRSEAGASAARTHTGHLAGSDAVHDAFFRQYGIRRVDDLDQLLEISLVLSRCPPPPTDGVGIFCISGGVAALLADLASNAGLSIPKLSEDTQATLRELILGDFLISNPVDTGGTPIFTGKGPAVAEAMLKDPAIGALLIPIPGVIADYMRPFVEIILHVRKVGGKPVIAIWQGPTVTPEFQELMDAGVPVVRTLRTAIEAVRTMLAWKRVRDGRDAFIAAARRIPPIVDVRNEVTGHAGAFETLDEAASMAWLSQHGIRFVEHRCMDGLEQACAAAEQMGYPVVLKARGCSIAHKTELGLVAVDLKSADELRHVSEGMVRRAGSERIEGWIVARMAPKGVELLAGLSNDPLLGPVVMLGAGGIYAEAMKDVSMSVLPLTRERARDMLGELRIAPLFAGLRGQPAIDSEAVVDVLMQLAAIAERGEAAEIDINPLLATPQGVYGLDALVRMNLPRRAHVEQHAGQRRTA